NAVRLSYPSVDQMVQQFCVGEDSQLDGVVRFITNNEALAGAFRASNWAHVAFFYNGSAYAQNGYDAKLQRYFELFSTGVTPDMRIRAAQVRLTYLGFDPRGID